MSTSIRRPVIIAAVAVLVSLPATAQSSRLSQFVTGKVFADVETSQLLANVPIDVCVDTTPDCTAESAWRTTRSNDLGRFLIANLAPGDYTIRARFDGHASAPESVRVRPGRFATVDLLLDIGDHEGAEIVVVPQIEPEKIAVSRYPGHAQKLDLDEYLVKLKEQGMFHSWTRETLTQATSKTLDFAADIDETEVDPDPSS